LGKRKRSNRSENLRVSWLLRRGEMTYDVLDMVWSAAEYKSPSRKRKLWVSHSNMKIVSRHLIKGLVRVYTAEYYCSQTLSRDMSKFVQKKMRTCGICITSFER
jgi:hypothetical protein